MTGSELMNHGGRDVEARDSLRAACTECDKSRYHSFKIYTEEEEAGWG